MRDFPRFAYFKTGIKTNEPWPGRDSPLIEHINYVVHCYAFNAMAERELVAELEAGDDFGRPPSPYVWVPSQLRNIITIKGLGPNYLSCPIVPNITLGLSTLNSNAQYLGALKGTIAAYEADVLLDTFLLYYSRSNTFKTLLGN